MFLNFTKKRVMSTDSPSETAANLLDELEALLVESRNIERAHSSLMKHKAMLQKDIEKKREELKEICNHNWDLDPPTYQERTRYTCSKCGNTC